MGLLSGLFGGKKDDKSRSKTTSSLRTKRSVRTAISPKNRPTENTGDETKEDAEKQVVPDEQSKRSAPSPAPSVKSRTGEVQVVKPTEAKAPVKLPTKGTVSSLPVAPENDSVKVSVASVKGKIPRKNTDSGTAFIPRKPEEEFSLTETVILHGDSSGSSTSRRKRTSIARKQIGNLLVDANVISEAQLQAALDQQEKDGGLLGQILCDKGVCTTANIGTALNKQRTITTVELGCVKFDRDAIKVLSREQCLRMRCVPFQRIGTMLCVAMSNVLDGSAKNEIKEATQLKLKAFDAAWSEIEEAIQIQFAAGDSVKGNPASVLLPKDTDVGARAIPDASGEDDLVIELPDEDFEIVDDQELTVPVEVDKSDLGLPVAKGTGEANHPRVDNEADMRRAEENSLPASLPVSSASPLEISVDDDVVDISIDDDLEVVELADDEVEIVDDFDEENTAPPLRSVLVTEVGILSAIPVSAEYFSRVTREGRVDLAESWSVERNGLLCLPARVALLAD